MNKKRASKSEYIRFANGVTIGKICFCLFITIFSNNSFATAGDIISNIATANYQLGGNSFTVESSPTGNTIPGIGNGTFTSFTVDNRINFNISLEDSSAVEVLTGQTDAVLTFRLTNSGNAFQDFVFTALNTKCGLSCALNAFNFKSDNCF